MGALTIRIAALCLKLGLKSATSHHIELAGVTMNAEDIARFVFHV